MHAINKNSTHPLRCDSSDNGIAYANASVLLNTDSLQSSDDPEDQIKKIYSQDQKRALRVKALQDLATYVVSTSDLLSLQNNNLLAAIETVFTELPQQLATQATELFWPWLQYLIQHSLSQMQIEALESKLNSMHVGACEQSQRIAMLHTLCYQLLPNRLQAHASPTSSNARSDKPLLEQSQAASVENSLLQWLRSAYQRCMLNLFSWVMRAWTACSAALRKPFNASISLVQPASPILYGPFPPTSSPPRAAGRLHSPKICV